MKVLAALSDRLLNRIVPALSAEAASMQCQIQCNKGFRCTPDKYEVWVYCGGGKPVFRNCNIICPTA